MSRTYELRYVINHVEDETLRREMTGFNLLSAISRYQNSIELPEGGKIYAREKGEFDVYRFEKGNLERVRQSLQSWNQQFIIPW